MAKNKYRHELGLEDAELHLMVHGSDFEKTLEMERQSEPDFPHLFTRKYEDLRRGRKKQK